MRTTGVSFRGFGFPNCESVQQVRTGFAGAHPWGFILSNKSSDDKGETCRREDSILCGV